jgi:hypothetical protein
LPHRLLEKQLRGAMRRAGLRSDSPGLRDALRRLPPRSVVILNGPRGIDEILPVPTATGFEPMHPETGDENDTVMRLNLEAQGLDVRACTFDFDEQVWRRNPRPDQSHDAATNGRARGPFQRGIAVCSNYACAVVLFGGLGYLLYGFLGSMFRGAYWPIALLVGLTALIGVPIFVIRVVLGRQTLLVPGGVALVRQPIWRKQVEVRYHQAATSALIADWPRCEAYVLDEEEIRTFSMDWSTLAAWLSEYPLRKSNGATRNRQR